MVASSTVDRRIGSALNVTLTTLYLDGEKIDPADAGEGAWVAQFNRDVHTSADGFGSGPTPWSAVQQAAWVAVKKQ